ncbi:MAG: Poly(beta-D-mannuronate) C5 epimerase 7 [Candidatus Heimdallarchaeota archaeon AB_125]|nr:MAG: Poly(beta-D-mannuronate) C5 epimerase 7 [Candidatus Heimdallarchaeota archaeon AB_125]
MVFSWRKTLIILLGLTLLPVNLEATIGFKQLQYALHEPIEITSDTDLLVFEGSGTYEEPYLIEGLNISTSDSYGIYVTNITKHLLIRNCFIDASFNSIFVENVFEGEIRIENNICFNSDKENGKGIIVFTTRNIVIQNNLCYDNEASGIVVTFCYNVLIRNNHCYRNGGEGIAVALIENLAMHDNECYDNSKEGLYLGGIEFATVLNNTCSRNGEEGVIIEESDGVIFKNNTIRENGKRGVFLHSSDYCFFKFNLFEKNTYFGLSLDDNCDGNQIFYNDFISNFNSERSQAEDNGLGNIWSNNLKEIGNFWDNLNGDSTYEIEGEAESTDLFPLVRKEELETSLINIYFISVVFSFLALFFFYANYDNLSYFSKIL